MLLVIDIGNTNIVLGVFVGERLAATWRAATDTRKLSDEYAMLLLHLLEQRRLRARDIKDAAISSVVPSLLPTFEKLCQDYFGLRPLVVEPGIKTGVRIATENPPEVGADRVVNAAAAYRLYGGPLIVIDLGTAITFDAISSAGELLGTAIAPGPAVAAEALAEHTAKLPHIELAPPRKAIGRNTITAMQSGIIFGYVGLVEGLVARIKRELGGQARVIATGGLAEVLAGETSVVDTYEPNLTLYGLRFIHELNRGHSDAEG